MENGKGNSQHRPLFCRNSRATPTPLHLGHVIWGRLIPPCSPHLLYYCFNLGNIGGGTVTKAKEEEQKIVPTNPLPQVTTSVQLGHEWTSLDCTLAGWLQPFFPLPKQNNSCHAYHNKEPKPEWAAHNFSPDCSDFSATAFMMAINTSSERQNNFMPCGITKESKW